MKKSKNSIFKIQDLNPKAKWLIGIKSLALNHKNKRYIFLFCLIVLYLTITVLGKTGFISSYYLQIIMFAGINIVMTVSLGMVNGFTGQFSIGHGGFMGVGAYTSIFFTTIIFQLLGYDPLGKSILGYVIFSGSVIIGGVFAGVAGLLIGLPTLHLKGDYLAIVTMAFGEVIRTIIRISEPLGGPRGVNGIPEMTNFTIVFIFAITSIWLMRNFLSSTYGRASRAIRDSEIAAELVGINSTSQKMIVFTISAGFAGLCGGLYAHILQYIHPDNFTFMKSLEYLIFLYIGGANSISGAMTGAFIFTIVPELLREFQSWRMVIFSLLLIVVMLFRPNGIIGDREFSFIGRK